MKNQNTPTTLPVIAATFAAITGLSSAAAPATLSHRWSFNGNLNDAVATAPSPAVIIDPDNNAATGGGADLTSNAGQITLGGGGRDQSSYVKLGTSLLAGKTTPVTIEFWATQIGIQNWARIFDFGTDTNQYLMMSWTRQTNANQDTLTWKNGAESAANDKNAPYELGREYHVVLVIEPGAGTAGQTLVTEYAAPSDATTMGAPKAVMSTSFTLANFADPNDFLGRSQWPDETAHASYNEFRIWKGAMVPEEIDEHQTGGPNLTGFVDTDTDGMPDWWETLHGLNIGDRTDANQDADHDGATNLQEYLAGSDPQDANSNALDLDGDKLTDSWEIAHFGGLGETGAGDPDNDGATNLQEQAAGSDPLDPNSFPDTDGDGINDVWEKKYFTGTGGIPAFNAAAANATNDYDGDGFTNLEEFRSGSNPVLATSSPAFPTLAHRWAFNGDLTDSVTGPDASDALIIDPDNDPATGPADLTTKPGEVYLAGGAKGAAGYVSVGTNLLTGNLYPVTVELWATTYSLQSWSRIFDFGSGENEYVMASWNVNGNESLTRTSWKNGAELSKDATFSYTHGTKYHIVVSIEPPAGTRKLSRVTTYAAAADGTATTMGPPLAMFYTSSKLVTMNDVNDYLGRSQFGDATANASYDEVRIWAGLLPEAIRDAYQVQGPGVPAIVDTDGDKMPDAWEKAQFNNVLTQKATDDYDGDGFNNIHEMAAGTAANNGSITPLDTDGDGLADAWEYTYFDNLDQDGDGDSDNDLSLNRDEFAAGSNPTSRTSFPDTEPNTPPGSPAGDGISDGWELANFGNLTQATATSDTDRDGFTDKAEFLANTNPNDPFDPGSPTGDGDNDGMDDRWEADNFPSALNLSTSPTADADGDGFNNLAEYIAGSDPNNAASKPSDVNGDGITDISLNLDFKATGTSGITDATGKVIGLQRLPGSGTDATYLPNDPNLTLDTTGLGTLAIKSGTADVHNQIGMAQFEALGIPLSSVGVTPTGDFKARAKFVNLPPAPGNDQSGVFVGASTTALTRFGRINGTEAYGTNTNGNVDTDSVRFPGQQMNAAHSMTLEVSRIGGVWEMKVNDVVVTPSAQPSFLDAQSANLLMGVYSLDLSGSHNTTYIDSLVVTRFGAASSGVADTDGDGMDDAWEIAKFGDLTQTGTGDFDKDGVNNLTEFAFNGDPKSAASRGAITSALTDTDANGKKELTMTVAVRTGATFTAGTGGSMTATVAGLTYAIQGTIDLVNFTGAVSEVGTPTADNGGYQMHTFRLTSSDGLAGKGFLRATVTK